MHKIYRYNGTQQYYIDVSTMKMHNPALSTL